MQCNLFQQPKPTPPIIQAPDDPECRVKLRSSQPLAIEMARDQLMMGNKRVIICAPCGFGKSVIACKYVENALRKNRKVWFVVDRQNLVNQMSQELLSFGIEHGVMMAGHERWWPQCNAQVASVQTLEKRGWDADIDLLLIDEVHALMRKSLMAFLDHSPKTTAIGFTATPFNPKLAKVFKAIVNPTTTNKQIE
jgi:DNA repair protein RadD